MQRMRLLNQLCRFLVGGLFIFSGLIKLNDPYGTAYKLQEYFEVFSQDISPVFHHFSSWALFLSIFISGFEVILGAAILLFYRMRITMWVTLLLILFFTFLTFYSFAFDKVKECGCFGTAIKLTAKQSFYKDLVLLALVSWLFAFRNKLEAGMNNLKGNLIILSSALLAFGIGIYTKNHLQFIDTTPYKVGNDLNILTKPKERARYQWILEKNGKEYTFDDEHYPSDTTYKYRRHILLTDSSLLTPEIAGFRIYNDEGEFTNVALTGKKIFFVISNPKEALFNCGETCITRVNNIIKRYQEQGYELMILTVPADDYSIEDYRHEVQLSGDYYFTDDTVLKAMIRSNPGIVLLDNGKILKKIHYNDFDSLEKSITNN